MGVWNWIFGKHPPRPPDPERTVEAAWLPMWQAQLVLHELWEREVPCVVSEDFTSHWRGGSSEPILHIFVMEPRLALVTFTMIPIMLFATWLFGRKAKVAFRETREKVATLVGNLAENIDGMRVIQSYAQEDSSQKRFESNPPLKATLLLLQERIPDAAALYTQPVELSAIRGISAGPEAPVRVLYSSDTPMPEVQLLSNGRYHVMVTNAGGGSSRWKELAVTRWREDSTCDNWGTFCYIRDAASGEFWSSAHQPTLKRAERYEAIFTEARAEFRRRDYDLESHTEIVVSPEDDIELRRLRITNRSRARRTIDVTSYAEVVLAAPAADALHPAFSNLFVQTEIVAERQAILCTRRPRSQDESPPWMFHLMAVHGAVSLDVSYETDRMAFIGRGRTVAAPQSSLAAAQPNSS